MANYDQVNPVTYRGQPYRSQAEGLWARLMTELRIPFRYEPVTVEFPDGRRYNPDFFLTAVGRYVEIKNYLDRVDTITRVREYKKANDLARCTGTQVTLINGRPAAATAYVFDGRPPEAGWENVADPIASFAYKKINGGSNALPILHELIQPSGYAATVSMPWYFQHGIRQRMNNLRISLDGELTYGIGPEAFTEQDAQMLGRSAIALVEPSVLPVEQYEAHPRQMVR